MKRFFWLEWLRYLLCLLHVVPFDTSVYVPFRFNSVDVEHVCGRRQLLHYAERSFLRNSWTFLVLDADGCPGDSQTTVPDRSSHRGR